MIIKSTQVVNFAFCSRNAWLVIRKSLTLVAVFDFWLFCVLQQRSSAVIWRQVDSSSVTLSFLTHTFLLKNNPVRLTSLCRLWIPRNVYFTFFYKILVDSAVATRRIGEQKFSCLQFASSAHNVASEVMETQKCSCLQFVLSVTIVNAS